MLVIGLTGGIGSGKSTASALFEELGITIIDADTISHQLMGAGTEVTHSIVHWFGEEILLPDGEIDRAKLAERVFNDARARQDLEAIVHPAVRKQILTQLAQAAGPYCILVVPLLLESNMQDMVDRVLVTDVPEEVQIARIQNRPTMTPTRARQIMAAQVDRNHRLAAASDIIDNGGDLEHLRRQIADLHKKYLRLAAN